MREPGQKTDSCTRIQQFAFSHFRGNLLESLPEGWLRGLDLNQRPLGYEPEENRLSSSFFGTSGTLRTFQEASVSGIGGLKGVCLEQPSQWCFPPSDWAESRPLHP